MASPQGGSATTASHPTADIARSLSPRPLIGFDDPPDDRVPADVGAGEASAVDPRQPFEPRHGVGPARRPGARQDALLVAAPGAHAADPTTAGSETATSARSRDWPRGGA